MLSYKEYKELNESLNITIPLGVKNQQVMSSYKSKWDEMSMPTVKMAKKKAKKFMVNSEMPGDHEFDGGEEDMLPAMELKGKKKHKPHFDDDEDMDDTDMSSEDEFEDEDEVEDSDDMEDSDDEFDDSEEEFSDEDDFSGDEEDDEEEIEDFRKVKKPVKKKPMPQMQQQSPDMGQQMPQMDMMQPKMMKKKQKGKCCCGDCKYCKMMGKSYMKKEHAEFHKNLQKQTGFSYFPINADGTFKEDLIMPPEDINKDIVAPGQVGYAPQTRIGDTGSYAPETFAEWYAARKKRK